VKFAMRDKALTMSEIWLEGNYLMTVEYLKLKANLYALHNDFVEVYYNDDTDSIEKIQRATDDDLRKYLAQIHSYLF
jgi:hypothetical protein